MCPSPMLERLVVQATPFLPSELFNHRRQLHGTWTRIPWCHDPSNVVLEELRLVNQAFSCLRLKSGVVDYDRASLTFILYQISILVSSYILEFPLIVKYGSRYRPPMNNGLHLLALIRFWRIPCQHKFSIDAAYRRIHAYNQLCKNMLS